MSTDVGDVIGDRYELRSVIGEGGMGRVLRARDRVLDRDVAVKVLRLDTAAEPRAAERLRREALRAAQVRHPNVVGVLDAVLDGDHPAVVLELVEGPNLAEVVSEGGFDVEDAVWLLAGVADGLQAAHAAGLVHRDVKPSNVLLDGGVPRVVDFGIARDLGATATATTSVRGSVAFLAPEQVAGDDVGPAADLYALGCLAHHLLVGSPPFRGATPAETVAQHLGTPAPSLGERRADVPPHVVAVVDQMLAKDPAERPASAGAVAAALRDPRRSSVAPTTRLPDRDGRTEHLAPAAPAQGRAAWQDAPDTHDERSLAGRRRRRFPWGALLALAVLVGLVVVVALAVDGRLDGLTQGLGAQDAASVGEEAPSTPSATTGATTAASEQPPSSDPDQGGATDAATTGSGDGVGDDGDAVDAARSAVDAVRAQLAAARDAGAVEGDVADDVDATLADAASALDGDGDVDDAREDLAAAADALDDAAADGAADPSVAGQLVGEIADVAAALDAAAEG